MGFFTDTSVCIGCKACEVACKEWNQIPMSIAGLHRQVLRQHGRPRRRHLAPRRVHRADRCRPTSRDGGVAGRRPPARGQAIDGRRADLPGGRRLPLADGLRRVQALHRRRLPRGVPDRRAVPHRVRHRRRAGGRLQRLRLLRPGLPVRRDRPARGRRPGVEVHALLRPAQGRPGAGLRPGLPDQLDPVRRARRAARARRAPARPAAGRRARSRRSCTSPTRTTGSAAPARSSCCSTSPRSTGCRPTRSTPRRDLGEIWAAAGAGARWRSAAALAAAVFGGARGERPRRSAPTTASR